jgi:glycerol-3-phosphate dehydrogenase
MKVALRMPAMRIPPPGRDADMGPVVVLGAGINGAAVARELALSGVPVAVVDPADIACGATAWSTRLIHGGLRYLEYGEFGLVRESLAERDRLVRLAPHLVEPLPFYVPVRGRLGGLRSAAARLLGWEGLARRWAGGHGRGSIAVGIGLSLYDLLATGSRWPRHRMVRAGGDGLPAVDRETFPFAGVYSDAQLLFPERFTVELLVDARRIATETGAAFDLFTHRQAAVLPGNILRITPRGQAAMGAGDAGDVVELRPAAIVNATGAWVDRTLADVFAAAGLAHDGPRLIGGTKGSHLILRSPRLRSAVGGYGVYAEADDGRPVFVLPFGGELVLVGTTDIPFSGDPAAARADEDEIAYLLSAAARIFPGTAPGRDDVQQHYCGVRPLPAVDRAAGSPAGVTRRHMLVRHPHAPLPVWSIVGGKLTTCRSLAETAAARILEALELPVLGSSRERSLPGACASGDRQTVVRDAREAARSAGFAPDEAERAAERTVALFGTRASGVFAAAGAGLIRGTALPLSAVAFCVREEWAVTLEDLVERRLMLSFERGLSLAAIEDVARELARLGKMPGDRVADEARACGRRLEERYGKSVPAM